MEKIEGVVYVEFLIDSLGQVKEPKIVRGIHEIYDKAALEVIRKMPNWKPGVWNGKDVSSYYTIPIKFE